jgi:hypothetical protein
MEALPYLVQETPGGSSKSFTTRGTSTTPKNSSAKGARSETVDQVDNGVIVTPLSDEDSADFTSGKVVAAKKIKDGTGKKPKTTEDGQVCICARVLEGLADINRRLSGPGSWYFSDI